MNLITTPALTMTSQEIAELVGSRHDNVRTTIERLAERGVIQLPAMKEVKNHLGQSVAVYLVCKRDSYVVVAQLYPEFTARLVDRWQELEQAQQVAALPNDYISALEHLLESNRSEQAAIAERDHAVATKALIGSKREATAMAKASAAVREANRLRDELGYSSRHATILKVENALGRTFNYVQLRRWCKANGITPDTVPDKRYADGVKAWPAAAWAAVYQIDLTALFGDAGEQP